MNKYQRISILFSTIVFLGGVLITVMVSLANATSDSRYETFTDSNITVTDCNVPQDYPNIQEAINNLDCDLVNVAAGTFVENVVINHDVTIQGASINSTIVDGNSNGTVIEIQEGLAVTLTDLTIRNGGPLTTPVSEGGGIRIFTGTLTVVDTLITANTANIAGAGIYGYASNITIHQSQVVSNSAEYYGGGIAGFFGSVTTIDNSIISNNTAMFGGGFSGGDINIIASTITDNVAEYGGGLYTSTGQGYITVTQSTISSNTATTTGGGIFAWAFYGNTTSVIVTNSSFTNNDASFGGGIAVGDNTWTEVDNSVISGNSANSGGGIRTGGDTLILQNTTLHGNSAYSGGGIFNEDSTITITHSTLSLNSVFDNGGGIYNLDGTLTLNNSTLSNNSSPLGGYGGGIYAASYGGGIVTLNNSTLSNNSATAGGGMYIEGADTVTTTGSIIAGNSGADCSGTITSQGYNIAGDSSCNLNSPGDMNNTDPQLGPLQDNDGPTQTHLPLAGSPAIDAGDPLNCPPTDQRGAIRPYDGDGDGNAICDIGSVEYLSPVPSYFVIYLPITHKP